MTDLHVLNTSLPLPRDEQLGEIQPSCVWEKTHPMEICTEGPSKLHGGSPFLDVQYLLRLLRLLIAHLYFHNSFTETSWCLRMSTFFTVYGSMTLVTISICFIILLLKQTHVGRIHMKNQHTLQSIS